MSTSSDLVIPLPIFDEAAAALKTDGIYETELSADDLSQIMRAVVQSLLAGQTMARATVPEMSVRIQEYRGIGAGAVRVESHIQATVRLNTVLANAPDPTRIRLEDLVVKQEAGFAAKLALGALNVEGRVREALADPNRTLMAALATQLEPRGARLTELALHINETMLSVGMHGGALA